MALDGSRANYCREKAKQVRETARRSRLAHLEQEHEQLAKQYGPLAGSGRGR